MRCARQTSLNALRLDLQSDRHVEAVFVSEGDRRSSEVAAEIVRQNATVPVILFRPSRRKLHKHSFDRVYTSDVQPKNWLLETAWLIAYGRDLLNKRPAC
ncbi:MAG: hypothetical protein C5B58_11655 [Acidobacteria bacterium]|nr:MAG: hypothetical protein C5B58_11655 [Acidobacteriota bacterium]